MKVWKIPDKYICRTIEENIFNVKKEIGDAIFVDSNPTNIAFLLNVRGESGDHDLGVISHFVLNGNDSILYIEEKDVEEEALQYLKENNIQIKKYTDFENDIFNINYIENNYIIEHIKSIKNEKELNFMKETYKKDEKLLNEFIDYVKNIDFNKKHYTEKMLMEELDNKRKKSLGFLSLSFKTIVAYKESAATIHYDVPCEGEEDKSKKIYNEGYLLIDSGAHYLGGTTDMTRTFSLGDVDPLQKHHYELVEKAYNTLVHTTFKKGTKGFELDNICRKILQDEGLDFNHGTGHGVGYMLCVHEAPPTITKKRKDEKGMWGDSIIEENQIFSIEPGLYFEGSHGIRIENLFYAKDCGNGNLKFVCLDE